MDDYQLYIKICFWGSLGAGIVSLFMIAGKEYYSKKDAERVRTLDKNETNEFNATLLGQIREGNDEIINEIHLSNSPEYGSLILQKQYLERLIALTPVDEEKIKYGEALSAIEIKLAKFREEAIQLSNIVKQIDVSPGRLKRAKDMLGNGKFNEASLILDDSILTDELADLKELESRENSHHESKSKIFLQKKIQLSNEYLLKAQLTVLNMSDVSRVDKAYYFFSESLTVIETKENTLAFASFLQSYNNYPEAIAMYEKALSIYTALSEGHPVEYLPLTSEIQRILGILYHKIFKYKKAVAMYKSALGSINRLDSLEHKTDVDFLLGKTYLELGGVYYEQRSTVDTRKNLELAIEIFRRGSELYPDVYKPYLGLALMNSGVYRIYNVEKSLKCLAQSVDLYRALSEKDSKYMKDLGQALTNYGVQAKLASLTSVTRSAYEEAYQIRKELYESNPYVNGEDFAYILGNYGNFLRSFPAERRKAFEFLEQSREIRSELSKLDPVRFSPNLAQSLFNIGYFYADEGNYEKAEENMIQVGETLEPFVNKNSELTSKYFEAKRLAKEFHDLLNSK